MKPPPIYIHEHPCIYFLADPRDMRPRYVGSTGYKERRLTHHIRKANGKAAHSKTDFWIRGLLAQGVRPVLVELPAGETEEDATKRLRKEHPDLLNIRDGNKWPDFAHVDIKPTET